MPPLLETSKGATTFDEDFGFVWEGSRLDKYSIVEQELSKSF